MLANLGDESKITARSLLQIVLLGRNQDKSLAPLSPQIRAMTLRNQGKRDPNLWGEVGVRGNTRES